MNNIKTTPKEDILSDTIEILELTIRAARRCAYDLKHAAEMVKDKYFTDIFRDNAQHYVKLFQSGNECKDYRHRLHRTISEHEITIERLRKVLEENKIEDPTSLCF